MIPPNFPETAAASGTESARLPLGGPWGPPEHIPARTAAPPRRAGPRPSAAAAGQTGLGGGGSARVCGTGTGHAPRPGRANPGTQRAGPGRGSAGLRTQCRRSSPQGAGILFPLTLVRSSPRLSPEPKAGVYFVFFLKSLHISGTRSPGPRGLFPAGACASQRCVPARVSAALCAVSFPVKSFSCSCFYFSPVLLLFSLSLSLPFVNGPRCLCSGEKRPCRRLL